MLSTTKLLFTFLVSTLIAISTATVPCCDFDPTCSGQWTSPTWQPSTVAVPYTAGYTRFLPTPNPYYEWLQDRSGALSPVVDFAITTTGAVISLDYYYYRPDPLASDDYFHVTFKTPSAINPTILASITTPFDGWQHLEIICDASLDYCCGPLETVPCTGTFEIIGSLNVAVSTGLFGVTNFGECYYVPTTTPAYTLPPPVPSGCCEFESNVCGLTTTGGWYWSRTWSDPYPIPYYSGFYMWTDIYGATAYSYEQLTIQPSTTFSVAFYVASTAGAIEVSFQDYAGPTVPLGSLPYTSGIWQHRTYTGYSLCTVFPCNGRFIFTARPGGNVVAFDDVERDGQCHGSFPCCYFDDPYYCDFNNPGYLGNAWKWSGISLPAYPPPYPTPRSDYVYFETVGYIGIDFKASLYSDLIDITSASSFIGNFYAKTPYGPAGIEGLELTFTEVTTGTATYMEFVKETYGTWMEVEFVCRGPHGDCCQGLGPYCRGSLAFVAHVQDNGGTVLFGIDAISDGSCRPFPGLTMKSGSENSTMIRLHA